MVKLITFLLKSFVIGLVSLFILNMVGQYFNLNIPINYFTIFLIGIFKIPGLIFVIAILLM